MIDYGQEPDGLLFVVMELVQGRPPRGPMGVRELVPLLRQVLDALQHMHDRRLLHRDIKPDNVLVTEAGLAKVIDLGIAKRLGSATATSPEDADVTAAEGFGPMTVAYAPPERFQRGAEVDERSDLWAVGVMAFELLTGRLPFGGGDVLHTMMAVANEPLPATGVDAAMDAWLARACAKPPDERFASADEMSVALGAVLPPTRRVPHTLFYGTSRADGERVMRHGLEPAAAGRLGAGVYLLRDPSHAFALAATEHGEDDVCIVQVQALLDHGRVLRVDGGDARGAWQARGQHEAAYSRNEAFAGWCVAPAFCDALLLPKMASSMSGLRGRAAAAVRAEQAAVRSTLSRRELVPHSARVPLVLFHGTSRPNAQSIAREGFRPSADGLLGAGVYLAPDPTKAFNFAQAALARGHGEGCWIVKAELEVDAARVVHLRSADDAGSAGWQEQYDAAYIAATSLSQRAEWCVSPRLAGEITVLGVDDAMWVVDTAAWEAALGAAAGQPSSASASALVNVPLLCPGDEVVVAPPPAAGAGAVAICPGGEVVVNGRW